MRVQFTVEAVEGALLRLECFDEDVGNDEPNGWCAPAPALVAACSSLAHCLLYLCMLLVCTTAQVRRGPLRRGERRGRPAQSGAPRRHCSRVSALDARASTSTTFVARTPVACSGSRCRR